MESSQQGSTGVLGGIGVIELSGEVGVRYCGRLFSVLGAHVVRVADPAPVDHADAGAAAFEAWLDQGKTLAQNLDEGLHLLNVAGVRADVLVAGQTPADVVAADTGIAAQGLDILRLGLTWFGHDGPYANWTGDDALIQALIGVAHGFGPVEGPATLPQGTSPQIIAGGSLYLAGLAALWGRRNGRPSRRVDVSVLEAAICFTETAPPTFEQSPGQAARKGVNRFGANHPTTVYPTADGWLGVTTLTPAQWSGLAALIGRPEWGRDPRFSTSAARVSNADLLDAELRAILPTNTTDHWLIEGQKLRVPLAPVPRHRDLLQTEHWNARESFSPLPGTGGLRAPYLPFRIFPDGRPRALPGAGTSGAPLAGLRVVDFSMGWAGPLATRHLGDLGAEIVKIESEIHYDWWRGWEPLGRSDPPAYELNPVFNSMNRGKLGVSLVLTTPEGVAHAKALVAQADIVIENYAPGVMAKLGLSAEVLQAARPGLIMVSMGAFGATGPWSFFRAYGSTVEHASGMPHANGHADWPPCLQHAAYGDPVAGIYAAIAALSVLHGRDRLGGAWVDLAQVECLFQLGADNILAAQTLGDLPRLGNRARGVAPRCVTPTADPEGSLAVAVSTDAQWRALCRVLDRDDWAADPALAGVEGRNRNADKIEAAIAIWAETRTAAEAAETLQQAGAPAAPIVPTHNLTTDPHLAATGCWTFVERKHVGRRITAAAPYHLDGARPQIQRPAPLLGQHTEQVLGRVAARRAEV